MDPSDQPALRGPPRRHSNWKVRQPRHNAYVGTSPTAIQGLICFERTAGFAREETVIRRINAFLNSDSTNHLRFHPSQLRPYYWKLYRRRALEAINEFIKAYPFLPHTPASLRATFGMPTRKDRKRGNFSRS